MRSIFGESHVHNIPRNRLSHYFSAYYPPCGARGAEKQAFSRFTKKPES